MRFDRAGHGEHLLLLLFPLLFHQALPIIVVIVERFRKVGRVVYGCCRQWTTVLELVDIFVDTCLEFFALSAFLLQNLHILGFGEYFRKPVFAGA